MNVKDDERYVPQKKEDKLEKQKIEKRFYNKNEPATTSDEYITVKSEVTRPSIARSMYSGKITFDDVEFEFEYDESNVTENNRFGKLQLRKSGDSIPMSDYITNELTWVASGISFCWVLDINALPGETTFEEFKIKKNSELEKFLDVYRTGDKTVS